jgi:hypothetical protein
MLTVQNYLLYWCVREREPKDEIPRWIFFQLRAEGRKEEYGTKHLLSNTPYAFWQLWPDRQKRREHTAGRTRNAVSCYSREPYYRLQPLDVAINKIWSTDVWEVVQMGGWTTADNSRLLSSLSRNANQQRPSSHWRWRTVRMCKFRDTSEMTSKSNVFGFCDKTCNFVFIVQAIKHFPPKFVI